MESHNIPRNITIAHFSGEQVQNLDFDHIRLYTGFITVYIKVDAMKEIYKTNPGRLIGNILLLVVVALVVVVHRFAPTGPG
jgi:hypothetical protein